MYLGLDGKGKTGQYQQFREGLLPTLRGGLLFEYSDHLELSAIGTRMIKSENNRILRREGM